MIKKPVSPDPTEHKAYSLISFEADNTKRIRVVALEPKGRTGVLQLVGENEQGKSSILDAIVWALRGQKAMPPQPIRKGESNGHIKIALGEGGKIELTIERTMQAKNDGGFSTTVTVRGADGRAYNSPQDLLNALWSETAADPLEFMRASPADQAQVLKRFVPVNLDDIARKRKEAYDDRTDVGRDRERARRASEGIVVPDDTPDELVDIASLMGARTAVEQHNLILERVAILEDEAERLRREAADKDRQVAELLKDFQSREPRDLRELNARLSSASMVNAHVAEKARRKMLAEEAAKHAERYEDLTETIERLDNDVKAAVAASKMPVPGLSLVDGLVRYKDFPLSQASQAEQRRVATAVALALNPNLKLVLIRDGALIDDDGMAAIEEIAREHGCLVIVERIKAADGVGAVVEIVDGSVKS